MCEHKSLALFPVNRQLKFLVCISFSQTLRTFIAYSTEKIYAIFFCQVYFVVHIFRCNTPFLIGHCSRCLFNFKCSSRNMSAPFSRRYFSRFVNIFNDLFFVFFCLFIFVLPCSILELKYLDDYHIKY